MVRFRLKRGCLFNTVVFFEYVSLNETCIVIMVISISSDSLRLVFYHPSSALSVWQSIMLRDDVALVVYFMVFSVFSSFLLLLICYHWSHWWKFSFLFCNPMVIRLFLGLDRFGQWSKFELEFWWTIVAMVFHIGMRFMHLLICMHFRFHGASVKIEGFMGSIDGWRFNKVLHSSYIALGIRLAMTAFWIST